MVYLPSATVSSLGLAGGALLLYGGSDVDQTTLSELLKDETAAAAVLNVTEWDTAAWLYDISADKWLKLAPVGDSPPGLMYHSMAVEGRQVGFASCVDTTNAAFRVGGGSVLACMKRLGDSACWLVC
jgi:hypothetical protein